MNLSTRCHCLVQNTTKNASSKLFMIALAIISGYSQLISFDAMLPLKRASRKTFSITLHQNEVKLSLHFFSNILPVFPPTEVLSVFRNSNRWERHAPPLS